MTNFNKTYDYFKKEKNYIFQVMIKRYLQWCDQIESSEINFQFENYLKIYLSSTKFKERDEKCFFM